MPQLAERFRKIPLDAIYSSPLQRAMQTAEAVNHYHHLPVQTEEGLCEIFAGEWEMKHFSDLPVLFPDQWRLWCEDEAHFCAPNGESIVQVHHRLSSTIDCIGRSKRRKNHCSGFPRMRTTLLSMPCTGNFSGADWGNSPFPKHSSKPGNL